MTSDIELLRLSTWFELRQYAALLNESVKDELSLDTIEHQSREIQRLVSYLRGFECADGASCTTCRHAPKTTHDEPCCVCVDAHSQRTRWEKQ